MRLNLAQALMCRSDLLLLDEPTNHPDLDAVMWLEDWLAATRARCWSSPMTATSSDRVADQILYFDTSNGRCWVEAEALHRQLRLVRGTARDRALGAAIGVSRSSSARSNILESFITRFKAKATKAAQAQSRIKALESWNASRRRTWIRRLPSSSRNPRANHASCSSSPT